MAQRFKTISLLFLTLTILIVPLLSQEIPEYPDDCKKVMTVQSRQTFASNNQVVQSILVLNLRGWWTWGWWTWGGGGGLGEGGADLGWECDLLPGEVDLVLDDLEEVLLLDREVDLVLDDLEVVLLLDVELDLALPDLLLIGEVEDLDLDLLLLP